MVARRKTITRKKPARKAVGPVIIAKKPGAMEPMEQSMGADPSAELPAEVETPEIVVASPEEVETAAFKERAANIAFMKESITVEIHDVAEKDAQRIFAVTVDGKDQVFERGKTYTVKRYFVEGLARAKPTNYRCEEYVENNITHYRYPANRGLRFPFSVIEDRNPLGSSWLKSVLMQP